MRRAGEFTKRDDDLRVVWGWASVIEEGGQSVVDRQGDVWDESELLKSAHDFIDAARVGGLMHARDEAGNPYQIGKVVESVVFTKAAQDALGIDLGKIGWWIGVQITDEKVWKGVKDGTFQAFSIGGTGTRTEVDFDAE